MFSTYIDDVQMFRTQNIQKHCYLISQFKF